MEIRRTTLLKVLSFSSIVFTEKSQLYSLHGQKSFTAHREDRVFGPTSLLSFRTQGTLFVV